MTDQKFTPAAPASAEVVQQIAQALDETAAVPLEQIGRLIEVLGEAKTRELLAQTEAIQAEGGLKIKSGSRSRTKGGVFFHLARQSLDPVGRAYVWPSQKRKSGPKKASAKSSAPALSWPQRLPLLAQIKGKPGEARTTKITLIGRPARVVVKGEVVLVSMPPTGHLPSLPRELPLPPAEAAAPTLVYIAAKQWRRVEAALKDPQDRLIVEGYPALDGRLKALTVYASNISTTALQRAKRPS